MGLGIFLSREIIFGALKGQIIEGAGFFIDHGFPYYGPNNPPPTVTAPLPNYPLFVFIFCFDSERLFTGVGEENPGACPGGEFPHLTSKP